MGVKKLNQEKKIVCTNPNCVHHGKAQAATSFYISKKSGVGRYPMCKDCILDSIDLHNMITVYSILKELDLPFDGNQWMSIVAKCDVKGFGNIIGTYIKIVSNLKIYEGRSFSEEQTQDFPNDCTTLLEEAHQKLEERIKANIPNLEQKEEFKALKEFWGDGYEDRMYKLFQQKFDLMKKNYPTPTAFHIENLRTFCMYKVMAEDALVHGDADASKKYADLARHAANDAKINVNQLSAADLGESFNSFSAWAKAVEQVHDVGEFIRICGKLRNSPIDSIDLEIYEYVNFVRKLSGKPEIQYADVYKFYDNYKDEYLKSHGDQYNLFSGDTTGKMRNKVEEFLKPLEADDHDGNTE